eukprot:1711146-Ditylum_brightwellii.AAC.1
MWQIEIYSHDRGGFGCIGGEGVAGEGGCNAAGEGGLHHGAMHRRSGMDCQIEVSPCCLAPAPKSPRTL